jgi:hypothetical protein
MRMLYLAHHTLGLAVAVAEAEEVQSAEQGVAFLSILVQDLAKSSAVADAVQDWAA